MSQENFQKIEKREMATLEANEQSSVITIESEKDSEEFAKETLRQIEKDVDSLPNTEEEIGKIESSTILDNPSTKNEIKSELDLSNKLHALDDETKGVLENAKAKISKVVQTKEFNQIADATPFVGGAKKITEGIYGETLSGEHLSDTERVKHGVKGAIDLGLDAAGVGAVQKGARMAYVGEKMASGVAENPEAVVNLGKKISGGEEVSVDKIKDDLATRDFSKAYHHPDYRSETAKKIVEARKTGGDAEKIKQDFYQKTSSEKENFESQEKERSVAEIMREKDLVIIHAMSMFGEGRGSSENNSVINNLNPKLGFEETYKIVAGLEPTISASIPSPDRLNNGLWRRQGVILGEGKILSAKQGDSGSVAINLQKRIPKYDNEDHEHSAIQPEIKMDEIVKVGEGPRGKQWNELTVEKPQIAGLYQDLSIYESHYSLDNPSWEATFGKLTESEMKMKIEEWKKKDIERLTRELYKTKEYSEKLNVPLYAFKNEGGELKKYRVDFENNPTYTEEYLKQNIVPKAHELLKEVGGNPNNPTYQEFYKTQVVPVMKYIKGERDYSLVPVTAEEIYNRKKKLSEEEKEGFVKELKEKEIFKK